MYVFTMQIFGVKMEVVGSFTPAEPQTRDTPGYPASFEAHTVSHKGEKLDVSQFSDELHDQISSAAFEDAEKELKKYIGEIS